MNNKAKPKFNAYTDMPHGSDDTVAIADLGIEFVHFDSDENPESMQTIPLGITYALWSGIGIIAIVLVALLAYKQVPSPGQLVGIAMITAGVIIVNLTGKHP